MMGRLPKPPAPPRIFLIEDDQLFVRLLKDDLNSEGWEFSSHGTVHGALAAIAEFKADLVLLDLKLPDGEGFEIARALREDKDLAKIPIIILSSVEDVQARLEGFRTGARDYVTKPFNVPELLARVRAHLAIREDQEKLERQVIEARLRERVRQDTIDMVVHDLGAPLATVKVTIDLIARHGLISREPYGKYLEYADESIEFALLMVNDLLDLSAGRLTPDLRPFDAATIFKRLGKIVSVQAELKEVSVSFEAPPAPKPFRTDPTLLFRVLANLVTNALKYTPKKGKVLVRASVKGPLLRLEVQDTGPGIPDAEKQAVFLKFYRAKPAHNKTVPGYGVGLAFCKLAVETLKGKIWVENASAKGGSRFVVEIPESA